MVGLVLIHEWLTETHLHPCIRASATTATEKKMPSQLTKEQSLLTGWDMREKAWVVRVTLLQYIEDVNHLLSLQTCKTIAGSHAKEKEHQKLTVSSALFQPTKQRLFLPVAPFVFLQVSGPFR